MSNAIKSKPRHGIGKNNFLIYAMARTGSTNLVRALNCHPEIHCVHEPLNPDIKDFSYIKKVIRKEDIVPIITEILWKYDGIKHVWMRGGWPFQNPSWNEALLNAGFHKIIFLKRKNMLKRIVSAEISSQFGIYDMHRDNKSKVFKALHLFKFRPLDVDQIKAVIESEQHLIDEARSALVDSKVPFFEVAYERIYSMKIGDRITVLKELLSFLKKSPLSFPALQLAASFLDRSLKMNGMDTYNRIPNIAEVERVCGSDKTGWLYK